MYTVNIKKLSRSRRRYEKRFKPKPADGSIKASNPADNIREIMANHRLKQGVAGVLGTMQHRAQGRGA